MSDTTYTILVTRDRGDDNYSSREVSGTLEELTEHFGYTLETGHSYDSRVCLKPKTIKSLVNNLYRASNARAANGYSGITYEII